MATEKCRMRTSGWRKQKLSEKFGEKEDLQASWVLAPAEWSEAGAARVCVAYVCSSGAWAILHLLWLQHPSFLSKYPQNPPAKHAALLHCRCFVHIHPQPTFSHILTLGFLLLQSSFSQLDLVFLCNVLIIRQLAGLLSHDQCWFPQSRQVKDQRFLTLPSFIPLNDTDPCCYERSCPT